MDIELLIKQVKAFLRMASEVTVYDEEINKSEVTYGY
nr:MAG TPA: hypothetical protein [Caudoviricetes sp.]